jgi:hypothetical protein
VVTSVKFYIYHFKNIIHIRKVILREINKTQTKKRFK